jgi:hypothetical protein
MGERPDRGRRSPPRSRAIVKPLAFISDSGHPSGWPASISSALICWRLRPGFCAVMPLRLGALPCRAAGPVRPRSALPSSPGSRAKLTAIHRVSFSGEPSGRLGAAARAGGDSPLQQQPPMYSLPRVDPTSRQKMRTNFLHVAEEPHFIIATRLVARRKMFRGPSIPFGNDNLPGGISVAVYYRFCSAPSALASALNLNRSRIGALPASRPGQFNGF